MKPVVECVAGLEEGMDRVEQVLPGFPRKEVALYKILVLVGRAIENGLAERLKEVQMHPSDFEALMQLFVSSQDSLTAGELAEVSGQTPTNMTRITNGLVKRGFAARTPSTEDRRRICLRVTPAGKRFVTKLLPPLFPQLERAFSGLTTNDKQRMERLLMKVAHNIDTLMAEDNP